jgi:hypothetical protein
VAAETADVIVDAFLYNGEADMLAYRRRALEAHVDRMVAVVSTLTHQSEPVPVPVVPSSVELLVIDPVPIPEGRGGQGSPFYQWIERQHRNAMISAAVGCKASDIVLVSDVDEIPHPDTLDEIVKLADDGPVSVPMRMHGFALDYLYQKEWVGTTASRVDALAPQAHRDWRYRLPRAGHGVHLSWFGDLDEKERKLRSFSHAELADLDVGHCYRSAIHATGEPLVRLSRTHTLNLEWPASLDDVPVSWWSPEA